MKACRAWFGVFTLLAALYGNAAAPANAQSVAMATDVSGKVTGQVSVTILAEITAESRIRVEAGARLVALYIKSGDEYTIIGPAQVQFRTTEPQVISGAAPQRRASPIARGGSVRIVSPVALAGYVMRNLEPTARIRLLTLARTKVLDNAPEFRWRELEPSLRYRFELDDDTGETLHEAEVSGGAYRLPSFVALREGIKYTWLVSTRVQDGRRYTSVGAFSVATAELRAQASTLQPGAGAPVSDRVAYAAWLEQVELRDEARKYWKVLAGERPEDPKLNEVASE
jgi:hypothetical protein